MWHHWNPPRCRQVSRAAGRDLATNKRPGNRGEVGTRKQEGEDLFIGDASVEKHGKPLTLLPCGWTARQCKGEAGTAENSELVAATFRRLQNHFQH